MRFDPGGYCETHNSDWWENTIADRQSLFRIKKSDIHILKKMNISGFQIISIEFNLFYGCPFSSRDFDYIMSWLKPA